MEAEDGALRHVGTRLMNLAMTLIQYITERGLYHLPEKQTNSGRVAPNAPYYRSVVGGGHPQPQPRAFLTEPNMSNRMHDIC